MLNSLAFLHQVLGLFEEASFYYKSAWKGNRNVTRGPQIRADTVCEFLAEIWLAKGPALLDSLESVIRDLRGGSRVSSQYVYWKAQGRESDMELSIGDPTVPIILIATEERLIGDGSM